MKHSVCFLFACAAAWCQDGSLLFQKHCAACHRLGSETRAPLPEALGKMSREAILASLETGSMKVQGTALNAKERSAVAAFLAPRVAPATEALTGFCPGRPTAMADVPAWNGWGVDFANSRFQPARVAGLDRGTVPKLKLKWAFGFPGANSAIGQPTISPPRLFLGSADGTVYSLSAETGCIWWTFKASSTVRAAITIAGHVAYFGDTQANVYALDTDKGELFWKVQVETHKFARVTGSPKFHAGRLYVPVSSVEEVPASGPQYPCCTFRGSVVALDAATGKQIWKTYTIPDPAQPTRQNSAGTQLMGPSGAAVWNSPTLDLDRKTLYVGTGNAYSEPYTPYTNAVLALDLESGKLRWSQQLTAGDGWNFSCINPNKASCPEKPGPDVDIGSSPILRRGLLIVGQKSGVVHALDPDQKGKIVWQTRIGRGGALGGVMWGSAADDEKVYVPLSDWTTSDPQFGGGLFALRISTGEKAWHTPPPKPACLGKPGCNTAQMAPASLIPGVIFSGSMDGHLRAYDTNNGEIIWDYDTLREFQTVNGVKARGGSLNATGPTIAGGMLFVNSGYGQLGGMAGNVLLAFSVDRK